MKKVLTTIVIVLTLVLTIAGCAKSASDNANKDASKNESWVQSDTKKAPADLTGNWKQKNGNSSDTYLAAVISVDTIDVYWISDEGDTQSLYWSGTFTAPTTTDEPYVWTSNNDHSKTENAILASNADTKEFTYQDGTISFSASAMGQTTTVKMEKTTEKIVNA